MNYTRLCNVLVFVFDDDIHLEQNYIFLVQNIYSIKTSISPFDIASFGTLWIQIGQTFESHWVFDSLKKIDFTRILNKYLMLLPLVQVGIQLSRDRTLMIVGGWNSGRSKFYNYIYGFNLAISRGTLTQKKKPLFL